MRVDRIELRPSPLDSNQAVSACDKSSNTDIEDETALEGEGEFYVK